MARKHLWLIVIAAVTVFFVTGCSFVSLMTAQRTEPTPESAPSLRPEATDEQRVDAPPLVWDQSNVLGALQEALATVYTEVNPSVVSIRVIQQRSGSDLPFLPLPEDSLQPYTRGSGSGFVWDTAGHIVTNYHVIEGASKINVGFADGTVVPATVVGTDRYSDLAVLQVERPASQLKPVRLAQQEVQVGQLSIAIGNPFGLQNTMTVGFISALGRSLPVGELGSRYSIPDIIQTDAPINPGNSGGVLVNERGEVIGVTTAIISPVQASVGIGFAIPTAIVQRVVPVLIEKGTYTHPWIGISGTSLTPELAEAMGLPAEQRGALVIEVVSGGPAERAGLRGSTRRVTIDGQTMTVGGDVIIALDDNPVRSFEDLVAVLSRHTRPGQRVRLTVLRDGKTTEIPLTLGERPAQ